MARTRVLFLCTGNSCRSQMAEGWAREFLADRVEPYSAGIEAHGMNENAVQVMAEAGVDISRQSSQTVDEFAGVTLDLVVTVCGHADENCPAMLDQVRTVHVGFEDPPKLARRAESELDAIDCYRRVRDEIRDFVRDRLPGLLTPASE